MGESRYALDKGFASRRTDMFLVQRDRAREGKWSTRTDEFV
jgi:hypothetical protein